MNWKFWESKTLLLDTKLPNCYFDADHVMLYACFTLLERVVEQEKYFQHWDNLPLVPNFIVEMTPEEYYPEEQCHERYLVDSEILYLYKWWQEYKEYLKDEDKCKRYFGVSIEVEDFDRKFAAGFTGHQIWMSSGKMQAEEEESNLIRLMKVRNHLWT